MKTEITSEEKKKLISRACPKIREAMDFEDEIEILKEALVKSLLKNMVYRHELRRLNQSVQYMNDVRDRNLYLASIIDDYEETLHEMSRDTDPGELTEEITKVETPNAIKSSIPPKDDGAPDSYREWDFRTRYPYLPKRAVGVV